MPIEIERKYLVKPELLKLTNSGKKLIQGYIWTDPNKSLRIRIANEKSFLTIKTGTDPLSRAEYEYEIPLVEAQELLQLCKSKIEKTRYEIHHENGLWEVDVFAGENEGLIIAEIELQSEDEKINLPNWIDREVTTESKYLNVQLIKHPFTKW